MRIILNLKREMRCCSKQIILLFLGATMLCGSISPLICGNLRYYYMLELPDFCLSAPVFVLSWCVVLALLGVSAGFVIGNTDKCRKKLRQRAAVLYSVMILLCALWYPVFFILNSMIRSLIVALAILVIGFLLIRIYVKVSLLSAIFMIFYQLWIVYCIIVNFCVIIIN